MSNKKLNKHNDFQQYKEKWGFENCRFRMYNGGDTIYISINNDETSKYYHEIKSLYTLIKRSSNRIKFIENNHSMLFNNLKEFQEYMLLRKLSGI